MHYRDHYNDESAFVLVLWIVWYVFLGSLVPYFIIFQAYGGILFKLLALYILGGIFSLIPFSIAGECIVELVRRCSRRTTDRVSSS